MRFAIEDELALFAESVRAVLAGWEPLPSPMAEWVDERDDALTARLGALGWGELWSAPDLLGPAVAGAIELGRALAPLHLVDEATLGAPLATGDRVRHGEDRLRAAAAAPRGGLVLVPVEPARHEPALDAIGTLVVQRTGGVALAREEAAARWRAWSATTLGYLAGLSERLLERTVEYALSREQFGKPLGALPAVQARLADAAVARDGLLLVAWSAASASDALPLAELAWAGRACRDVTAASLQVHGAIGFALESGLHRYFRRAKTLQVWTDAVRRELAS